MAGISKRGERNQGPNSLLKKRKGEPESQLESTSACNAWIRMFIPFAAARIMINRIATIIAMAVISSLLICTGSLAVPHRADRVLVIKNEKRMVLMNNGEIIKSYRVALGRNPAGPKIRQGDCRTPEGRYVLDHRNSHSRFYRSIHISYPNSDDIAGAKKRGVNPGEGIMIHGLPKGFEDLGDVHAGRNWTKGCIAVSNEEMDEIWAMVPDGTPIEIRP